MKQNPNIAMLEIVAKGLGKLCDDVVFVGGSVTAFYIQDSAATAIRPTNDVDCIIELAPAHDYLKLEAQLRALGFKNHIGTGRSFICRWDYQGVIVDIMTTDATTTGFTNQWYAEGILHRKLVTLPSDKEIYILTLPYFMATKFEAFKGRGVKDYRTSHDIEDIVTVLDGSKETDFNAEASQKLKKYLQNEFFKMTKNNQLSEILYGHMSRTGAVDTRVQRLINIIKQF